MNPAWSPAWIVVTQAAASAFPWIELLSVAGLGYLAAGLQQVRSDFGEGTFTPKKYTREATPASTLVAVLIWPLLATSWIRRTTLWIFSTLLAAGPYWLLQRWLKDAGLAAAAGAALLTPWLVWLMLKKRGRDGAAV